jgi:hypothetical protein
MTKDYCDKCGKGMLRMSSTSVRISWGFWNKMRDFDLCKDCDQSLRNLVARFLRAD